MIKVSTWVAFRIILSCPALHVTVHQCKAHVITSQHYAIWRSLQNFTYQFSIFTYRISHLIPVMVPYFDFHSKFYVNYKCSTYIIYLSICKQMIADTNHLQITWCFVAICVNPIIKCDEKVIHDINGQWGVLPWMMPLKEEHYTFSINLCLRMTLSQIKEIENLCLDGKFLRVLSWRGPIMQKSFL